MNFETIIYQVEDGIAVITLNRPRAFNALNNQLVTELGQALDLVETDASVGVLIVTGRDKFFGAGADLTEVIELATPAQALAFCHRVGRVINKMESLPKPVIAAVSGLALGGGCELALACDIRIATTTARFGQPEIKLGLIPGAGGTQRLPRLVGAGRAKELLFTGDPIDAAEAYRIGLVNKIVPEGTVLDEAKALAVKLLKQPPLALKATKAVVNEGLNMDLKSALAHEAQHFALLFSTADQKEGVSAFLEKRPPRYKGE
ncbi:MAG: enoyl-CoA hydratase-related protein [Thermodesulfobacteriota bacterium]